MSHTLRPIGFWSYARQDDESFGRLSALRSVLRSLIQVKYGREPIELFQDVAAIPYGEEWEAKIRTALDASVFMIPIITPNYIQSEWCCRELLIFREREKELNAQYPELKGRRRIFPLHYDDIAGIEPWDPAVLTELGKLQFFDFRKLVYQDVTTGPVQEPLSRFAGDIKNLLLTKVSDTPADPDAPGLQPPHDPIPPAPSPSPGPGPGPSPWPGPGPTPPPVPPRPSPRAIALAAVAAVVVLGALYLSTRGGPKSAHEPQAAAAAAAPATAVDPAAASLVVAQLIAGPWALQGLTCSDAITLSVTGHTFKVASSAGESTGDILPDATAPGSTVRVQTNEGVYAYRLSGEQITRVSPDGGAIQLTRCAR